MGEKLQSAADGHDMEASLSKKSYSITIEKL